MGYCEICEVKPATHICKICGRHVCEDHYVSDKGVCSICLNTLCRLCWRNLSVTTCPICGRIVCFSCSIEVEPSLRICRECFDRYKSRLGMLKDFKHALLTAFTELKKS